jgi:hypothetical protein
MGRASHGEARTETVRERRKRLGNSVADPEKYRSGGKSTDWGHLLYKFVKSKEISFKYVQIQ